ncbi:hypothetical protein Q75_06445 [Bacillus coahuilensis p1.1.43]|uniref:Uncharacterized protein n=1 Tax=Bacillus coahuilensis p1.1.43 TaxID=1150625 RepID=A0A147K9Q2_9BACI|nr:hypothetical protein [Bacillus coahuilensis]KUP07162.1 hypothetical protein Q75_06445 [Bacillus coahuilensis p1.1.43]
MKRRRPEIHQPLGAGAGQRKAEAARSGPTRVVGASLKALFAFWEVTTTLEGLAAGAGHQEKRSRLFRGVWTGGLGIEIKETRRASAIRC